MDEPIVLEELGDAMAETKQRFPATTFVDSVWGHGWSPGVE